MSVGQTAEAYAAAVEEQGPSGVATARRWTGDGALRRMLLAGDAATVLVALGLALMLSPDRGGLESGELLWGLVAIPLMVVLFKAYGLYDRDVKRINHSTVDDLPWLAHAAVIGTLLLWLYARNTPMHRLDFAQVIVYGLAIVALVTAARFFVRETAARVIGRDRALLVGGGAQAQALVDKLAAHPRYRVEVIGSLTVDESTESVAELPVLGALDELGPLVESRGVRRVILGGTDLEEQDLEPLLRRCRELSLKVSLLPKLSDVLGPAVEIDDVEGVAVLGVNPPWLPRSSRALKRVMDLVIAGAMLVLAVPVLLALALLIRLDSRGPVLFAQERVGKGGRRFHLLKLRTMVADAEQRHAELLARSDDPNWLLLDHDPRVTRVGRWLRRLSLDELPQLLNVLRGEMSLVGPRPLVPAEDERVQDWARGRLDLTPGLTGYWQVLGRTRIPFEEMVKLDYLYVMNWSLWEDVRLMLRTLPIVLAGSGAN